MGVAYNSHSEKESQKWERMIKSLKSQKKILNEIDLKGLIVVIIFLIVVTISGCSSKEEIEGKRIQVDVMNFEFEGFTINDEAEMKIDLAVSNFHPFNLSIEGIEYKVRINNIYVGIWNEKSFNVSGLSTTEITSRFKVKDEDMSEVFKSIEEMNGANIVVDGNLRAGEYFAEFTVNRAYTKSELYPLPKYYDGRR